MSWPEIFCPPRTEYCISYTVRRCSFPELTQSPSIAGLLEYASHDVVPCERMGIDVKKE
jgi:hypothetical protein